MNNLTQRGYFVLADISGYTSFVAQTELEHSQEILSDLLGTICASLELLLTIHKLEGDAVFAYTSETRLASGETILELVETTYTAFRDRQEAVSRSTTCTCQACRNIPTLDLKFIVHYGEYVIQQVREIKEMAGSDVNLVHRLLKNHISEVTGWRAYALFTEKSLAQIGVRLEDAHVQVEEYEHLGAVTTCSLDLRKRYTEIISARRVVVTEGDADFVMKIDFPTPPPVTWEWLHDPVRRNQWGHGVVWYKGERPKGRMGSGAVNHCAHGKSVNNEVILDWRPFEYATMESSENGKKLMTETMSLSPGPSGGTLVQDNIVVHIALPRWLRRPIAGLLMTKFFKYDTFLRHAAQLAGEEMSNAESQ